MFLKSITIAVFLASVSTQDYHGINVGPALARYTFQPIQAKLAIPVATNYAAPSASSYFNAPVPAPVYAGPAKVVVPEVAKYAPAPAAYKEEEYAHPKYEYAYSIEDHHTGDAHSQQEQRDGDHVVGQYSLHEADGTIRIVKYYDDGHGFNAIVERQGTPTEAPAVVKKVAVPVAVAGPHYQ